MGVWGIMPQEKKRKKKNKRKKNIYKIYIKTK